MTSARQRGSQFVRRARLSAVLLAGLLANALQSSPSTATTAPTTKSGHKGVAPHQTDPLELAAMRAYLSSRIGNITIALYDTKTAVTYLYRPGVEEQTASIVKVDIREALLHQYQKSKSPLGEENGYLASLMIEDSDDDAATSLWNEVSGAAGISRYNDLAGLTATVPNTAGYWGETMTTALDQVDLVKYLVFPHAGLNDASRAYELELMRHVIPLDYRGIATGPSSSTLVAVKNGWVPILSGNWQINSIGYVTGDGRS